MYAHWRGGIAATALLGLLGGGASAGESAGPPKGIVLVPAGGFMMGCSPGESACNGDEKLYHSPPGGPLLPRC